MDLEQALAKIKELETTAAASVTTITTLTKERDDAVKKNVDDVKKFTDDIKKKDEIIDQKTKDIVGARRQTQELKELTDKEKEDMTQTEIDHHNALLQEKERGDRLEKEAKERTDREVGERRGNIFKKYVGTAKPELVKKFEDNFKALNGSDKALTEGEISGFAEKAWNMLGAEKPNPVHQAVNNGGGEAGGESEKSFADTPDGQGLAGMLNLSQTQADTTKK